MKLFLVKTYEHVLIFALDDDIPDDMVKTKIVETLNRELNYGGAISIKLVPEMGLDTKVNAQFFNLRDAL